MLVGASLAGILFAQEGWRMRALDISSQNLPFFLAAIVLTVMAALSYLWVYKRKMIERT